MERSGRKREQGLPMNWNIQSLIPLAYAMEPVFNYVFMWCGMSIIAGAVSKILVPDNPLHGTTATFLTGFLSMTVSAFLMKLLYLHILDVEEFNPFHPIVLIAAIFIGAVGVFICRCFSAVFAKKS